MKIRRRITVPKPIPVAGWKAQTAWLVILRTPTTKLKRDAATREEALEIAREAFQDRELRVEDAWLVQTEKLHRDQR